MREALSAACIETWLTRILTIATFAISAPYIPTPITNGKA